MQTSENTTPSRTLVLNQGYEPVKVVSWKRAMKLFFLGKAEVVEPYREAPPLHSQYLTLEIPAVIRFTQKTRYFYGNLKLSRKLIFRRDNFCCQYCGKKFHHTKLTVDHVVPRSKGGKRTWTNLTTACFSCNQKKGNRTLKECGLTLLSKPQKPTHVAQILFNRTTPEQWLPFIEWYQKKNKTAKN